MEKMIDFLIRAGHRFDIGADCIIEKHGAIGKFIIYGSIIAVLFMLLLTFFLVLIWLIVVLPAWLLTVFFVALPICIVSYAYYIGGKE